MRVFHLIRSEDPSGISGTGIVAEGVEFHDGQIVMSWFGPLHTIEHAPNITTILHIHGHNNRTRVEWITSIQAERTS